MVNRQGSSRVSNNSSEPFNYEKDVVTYDDDGEHRPPAYLGSSEKSSYENNDDYTQVSPIDSVTSENKGQNNGESPHNSYQLPRTRNKNIGQENRGDMANNKNTKTVQNNSQDSVKYSSIANNRYDSSNLVHANNNGNAPINTPGHKVRISSRRFIMGRVAGHPGERIMVSQLNVSSIAAMSFMFSTCAAIGLVSFSIIAWIVMKVLGLFSKIDSMANSVASGHSFHSESYLSFPHTVSLAIVLGVLGIVFSVLSSVIITMLYNTCSLLTGGIVTTMLPQGKLVPGFIPKKGNNTRGTHNMSKNNNQMNSPQPKK